MLDGARCLAYHISMSINKAQLKKERKTSAIITVSVLIAFLIVAVFATITSVVNVTSILEGNVLANKTGIPESWNKLENTDMVKIDTKTQTNDDYVEYVTSVKNSNDKHITLTSISSYLEEGTKGGFVPLAEKTLEYTYDPGNDKSWTPAQVIAPNNNKDGYKFNSALYLGESGSTTDTIYFRYNIFPLGEGSITNKVAFVTENEDNDLAISINDSSLDYKKSGSSKAPSTTAVSVSSLGAVSVSQEVIVPSIIIMSVALGMFTASLIVYLVIRKKSRSRKKRR